MVGSPCISSYSTQVLQWKQSCRMCLGRNVFSCREATVPEDRLGAASPRAVLKLLRCVERGLEARVDHYLVASDELVRFVRHPDYLLELFEHRRRHPLAERGRGMEAMQYWQLFVTLTAM